MQQGFSLKALLMTNHSGNRGICTQYQLVDGDDLFLRHDPVLARSTIVGKALGGDGAGAPTSMDIATPVYGWQTQVRSDPELRKYSATATDITADEFTSTRIGANDDGTIQIGKRVMKGRQFGAR